jgi:hypothetical protein
MSTRRWAGAGVGVLFLFFGFAGGCGGDDSAPPPGGGGDAGPGGDSSSVCSTAVTKVEGACNLVSQNGRQFSLDCSGSHSEIIEGRAVCAKSGGCVMGCLDPNSLQSCLQNCRLPQDGGGDGGETPLGIKCMSNTDCSGGLTCLKPTDNIVPGSGPPNGLCTTECATAANENFCKSLGGTCIALSASPTAKAYCMETCATGPVTSQFTKCHGRDDMMCAELDPAGFGCVPICESDADCGTRKCDLASGLCADFVTPGAPIGSPCTADADCAGRFCFEFDPAPDAASSAGVCTAICRLGSLGCKFRVGPLDAGAPVGACLLSTPTADIGDVGICAQLCDSVHDCSTNDPRWTCRLDATVFTAFQHLGYCWTGVRPDGGGPRDASAPEVAPETGAPETGADVPPESGSDAAADTPTPPPDGPTE